MGDQENLKQILARCAKLADQVATESAKKAASLGRTREKNASKAKQLAELIQRLMAKASSVYYDCPVRVIMAHTERRLKQKPLFYLETCVDNVAWLLDLLFPDVNQYPPKFQGLPPFAMEANIRCYVWKWIVHCYRGTNDERWSATFYLHRFSFDGGDKCKMMIIEEGGVQPLLKLLKEGGPREQVAAAKVLGSLLHGLESAKHLVAAGVFPVFAKILEEGVMEVRAEVAHAITELAILQDTLECRKMIRKEGRVRLLLKMLKEGGPKEQVDAAKALGSLLHDLEIAKHLVVAGAFPVFTKILEEGVMEVRAEVAHAISELPKILQQTLECKNMIIKEGGVWPLLKLLKEGCPREQVAAVKVLSSLLHDLESAKHLVAAGVVSMFAKILKEGIMEVQAEVAYAVSDLVEIDPRCQDSFAQHQAIQSLVTHLAFETVEGHLTDDVSINKATSVLAIVMSRYGSNTRKVMDEEDEQNNATLPSHQENPSVPDTTAANTKARMKAMAAKALASLAKENASICRAIVETRELMCFAVLMEKGQEDVKYYSAKALMEITSVAEQDTDLRRLAFRPSSPAFKAIVDQLVKIIESCDSESTLLVSSIKAIGNLARTFRVTETRIIIPLVRLLDLEKDEVCREASIALTKFVSGDNLLHLYNARAILDAGGAKQLVVVIHYEEVIIQKPALSPTSMRLYGMIH